MISLNVSSKCVLLRGPLNPIVKISKKVTTFIYLIIVNQEFIENSRQTIQQNMTLGDLSDLLTNMCSQESIIKPSTNKEENSKQSESESNC